ncbi:uncharacterized protein LOC141700297 [Apium graveolens]|uniref:uncharacterized protein LOC141666347 n=1 Tax=Apium graveolens TaxID=4045 RepID=UPI003D7A1F13
MSPHQNELVNFISENHLDFMGVLETKVKLRNANRISKKINKNWKWLFNYDHHYNGRVWVGWNSDVWDISLHSSSAQHMTCSAHFIEKNLHFLITFVYAYNEGADRNSLWKSLYSFSSCLLPWCVLGDFNCISALNEVSGGREHWTLEMQSFKDCIVQAGLGEVRTVRDLFTWYNKRLMHSIHKRLDRMLANGLWFGQFTEGNAFVKHRGIMDHNPVLFHEPMQLQKFGKPFQFFNYMLGILSFLSTVEHAWQVQFFGDPMVVLARKIKLVKQALKELNKSHGDLNDNVASARANLNDIQEKLNVSKVLTLEGDTGLVHGQANCARVAVSYFSDSLGKASSCTEVNLSSLQCPTLSQDQYAILEAPVTSVIIYNTLKKMKKNKAPGPDGLNVEFFLATWHITGPCFCDVVHAFFETSAMHHVHNSTLIALIPKTLTPTQMNFRPISLCMVFYKCISKIIASRLKNVLPSLIDSSQSAFIPARSISDNLLLAQELFRGYNRETGAPRCALKVDLHKAFDSLQWPFVLATLEKMGFSSTFISWIKACICTTKFSIKLNGVVHGYFDGAQGIRQGDPLSPYLFTICMNVLSCLLKPKPSSFKYHWK